MDLLTAQGVSDKVVYILERKRLEHHLLDDQTGLANGPQRQPERMRLADLVVAIGPDNQEVGGPGVTEQMFQQREGRRINPLQVVQKKDWGGPSWRRHPESAGKRPGSGAGSPAGATPEPAAAPR
jgi:hypothetical protein